LGKIPELQTSMVLESIGQDLLIFLAASVVVVPLANIIGISPILGYLILGAWLGPNGLDFFANSKADVELGDFGILFLLFSEGLEVSKSRLNKLAQFLPLAFAQISLCAAALSWGILNWSNLERFVPLDDGLINISQPTEALILALALTLSTSAFVFPVLNERGWEDEESGQAATSILLLQDLAVAPLLVLLPFVVGQGPTDYAAIGFLSAKASIGFGSIIFVGSIILQKVFTWIAKTRSTETFVALCLLVSVGMGTIAKSLGLTDTAGAFAAGVLLANTNYRAQIQADILPFKGILLGIFFMVAGSSFDINLCIREFPTVATGVLALIALKAITLFLATRVPSWL
jgi:Kef-type K+ transport system membrane component KefB